MPHYDASEGEFVDFETLDDWRERDKDKNATIARLTAELEAAQMDCRSYKAMAADAIHRMDNATAAYTAAIRAAEVRGMREAAGIAKEEAWPEEGTYPPHEKAIEDAERSTVAVIFEAIIAAATAKENAHD